MQNNEGKTCRTLAIYERLRKGVIVNKRSITDEFKVNARTIQRDLDEIRMYLSDNYTGDELYYDSVKKGYIITNPNKQSLSEVETYAIIKILLESRAFCREEMQELVTTVINAVPKWEQKIIKELIANEQYHFQPLQHNKPILKIVWDLEQCVRKRMVIEIDYYKITKIMDKRIIHPLAVVFSEYYFYLVAKIEGKEYKTPAFFRIDRIRNFIVTKRKFSLPETLRFEEGELKKRVQFMHGGDLFILRFVFWGASLEVVLDKFPTAKVIYQKNGEYTIEAEVYGKGCLMWLLSQGDKVKILSPEELRVEVKQKVENLIKIYSE